MTAPAAPEVRRCAKCQAVAAVCDRDWKHANVFGESGVSTRDFACQECGHRFTLVPMMRIYVWAAFAVLFSFTCVMPVVAGGYAVAMYWPYFANPVVAGAPLPVIRFRTVEPTRTCARCGGVARCRRVTRSGTDGVRTGTDYDYACDNCGREFTIESWGGLAFNVFGAVFCFLLGFGCMPAGLLLWLMSAALLLISAVRIAARVRNPLAAERIAGP